MKNLDKIIFLDPGHGGRHPGAVSQDGQGRMEKTATLAVSLYIRDMLEAAGVSVRMTREADVHVSLADRAKMANRAGAAAFVSVHFNSTAGDIYGARGVETWAHTRSAEGQRLAGCIQAAMVEATGLHDRGVKKTDVFAVLRRTHMPAVVVEGGFISHPEEAAWIWDDASRRTLARGIADGILQWLGA